MEKIIFIVDDNDANLVMASSALEDDYKVLTMPSAQKMFWLLERKKADLILLDIEMPEITGFEAIEKLKEDSRWKDIPVIFLTGRDEEEINAIADKTQALAVVNKPIEAQVLKDCVKKYLSDS